MKIIKKFAVIVIASFVLGFSFYLIRPAANCNFESAYQIKPLSVGLHKIQAAVADTDALRQNGLGDRSCINKNAGMLFIFDTPGKYGFWMKDMRFAIDIVWLDANKKVISYNESVQPSTYPAEFYPTSAASYVVELNSHQVHQLGITKDSTFSW